MRYALIVIDQPKFSLPEEKDTWNKLSDILSGMCEEHCAIERPNPYFVAMPLHSDWCSFIKISYALQEHGFSYRVLFLDNPEWLYSAET